MRKCNLRAGSALLIVLGMLTFLIVSAVGFSAYMRQGRLPSSQLRRMVAGRHLVKAAMAEAIDIVDQAINDNPHPGVGDLKPGNTRDNINFWHNRIFMGTNQWDEANFVNTVSPLCLEALAYIPPPLINSARYFSRLSLAAQWKSFDFDVGRYAFCAIDVSDYFDVNRLFANKRRSSAPHERVSLAYLFEKSPDHSSAGTGAKEWDDFMKDFRKVDEETGEISYDGNCFPLISLADFNLALKGGVGKMKSPFIEYIEGRVNEICDMGQDEESDAMLSRMTFMTDSLFPKTKNAATPSANSSNNNEEGASNNVYDISDPINQPFDPRRLSQDTQPPDTLMNTFTEKNIQKGGGAGMEWAYILGNIGSVCLYDYLDADRKPLSLAFPTVERFPMICGIEPTINNIQLAIVKEMVPTDNEIEEEYSNIITAPSEDNPTRIVEKTVYYKIDRTKFQQGLQSGIVRALTVYPFARKDDNSGSYEIDGKLSFFFSLDQKPMSLRTSEDVINYDDKLHLEKEIGDTVIDKVNGIINVKFNSTPLTLNESIGNVSDAVTHTDFRLGTVASDVGQALQDSNNAILKATFQWTQTKNSQSVANTPPTWSPTLDNILDEICQNQAYPGSIIKVDISTSLPALNPNGAPNENFTSSDSLKSAILTSNLLRLNCALWLRIKDKDGYVVDMVPACLEDDRIQNDVESGMMKQMAQRAKIDPAFPLLRFNTNVTLDFSLKSFEEEVNNQAAANNSRVVNLEPKAAMVADPRYNYAPEEWFSHNGGLSEQEWLSKNMAGSVDRDSDIFMETSDAGYLQSVYELAFLPRTKPLENNENSSAQNMSSEYSTSTRYTDIAKSFDNSNSSGEESITRNHAVAWRTYNPFRLRESYGDKEDFKNLPFVNEGNGFKINPYSDSTNVLMAVFANTPIGWRQASTNKINGAKVVYADLDIEAFNKEYVFNGYTIDASANIKWFDLEKVAGKFIDEMRDNNDDDNLEAWKDVFDNMDWGTQQNDNLLGVQIEGQSTAKFWGVDKKFLYGFWKDSFAVKQQLFLIFVRAEPAMMGSGAAGHTPPQLGGKAVALVWRDPTKSTETSSNSNRATPHKTRVLFYRQFE